MMETDKRQTYCGYCGKLARMLQHPSNCICILAVGYSRGWYFYPFIFFFFFLFGNVLLQWGILVHQIMSIQITVNCRALFLFYLAGNCHMCWRDFIASLWWWFYTWVGTTSVRTKHTLAISVQVWVYHSHGFTSREVSNFLIASYQSMGKLVFSLETMELIPYLL